MKTLRYALSIGALVLLGAGYFASQYFALNGTAAEWTVRIETPAVPWLALALLVGAIVLSLKPEKEEKV
jgi:hypothetical protein